MANKLDVEDIFRTFTGQDVVVIGPFIRQKYMLPFWHILHLIFAYDIEPRAHMTECPILRGELMLFVARGCVVDLPLAVEIVDNSLDGYEIVDGWPWIASGKVSPRPGHRLSDQLGRTHGSGAKGEYTDDSETDAYVVKDLYTHLTTLGNNFALTERGLRDELNAM
ncbi:hypothetical protein CJ030_MR5G010217 [Morella rubra]|uniref:Uncharacterized protein n=1 Tax=Morella rubra TaxID=262757 RepID=A0A6A1VLW7_9ROSI|nr:hypothetical protein CJ030_MR5G010217 [Morella rubra]